jgi:hypothetical protein
MRIRSVMAALAILVGCPTAASADIFAATEVAPPSPRTDVDIALVDVSTGVFGQLPAGINTTATEFHPSVTADGTLIAFQRHDFSAGTDRILMASLVTGQVSDLFSGFEVATMHPTSPSITPDGKDVLTGGPVDVAAVTDVSAFPAGPYPHTSPLRVSELVDPVATGSTNGSLIAFRRIEPETEPPATVGSIAFKEFGGNPLLEELKSAVISYAHPAIGSPGGTTTVLFDQHNVSHTGQILQGDIGFCVPDVGHFRCPTALLPPIVNTGLNETRPAFTPDGRYVGFIRDETTGHERLFIWDSATQTLLNSTGVDLGHLQTPDSGNLSLFVKPVFSFTGVSSLGTASFSLLQPSNVGILVQRVVGHHKLFGRTVPTLMHVGRVPLGAFRSGPRNVHWNLRVNGKRLPPGTYLVTVRALTSAEMVRDMGTPQTIRIRR